MEDNYHITRWGNIHLRDKTQLKENTQNVLHLEAVKWKLSLWSHCNNCLIQPWNHLQPCKLNTNHESPSLKVTKEPNITWCLFSSCSLTSELISLAIGLKGIAHRIMKMYLLSTHHYADGGVGELFESTKHFRSFRGKHNMSPYCGGVIQVSAICSYSTQNGVIHIMFLA